MPRVRRLLLLTRLGSFFSSSSWWMVHTAIDCNLLNGAFLHQAYYMVYTYSSPTHLSHVSRGTWLTYSALVSETCGIYILGSKFDSWSPWCTMHGDWWLVLWNNPCSPAWCLLGHQKSDPGEFNGCKSWSSQPPELTSNGRNPHMGVLAHRFKLPSRKAVRQTFDKFTKELSTCLQQ